MGLLGLILPVGISFYTFQSMSYTIDIYRGQLTPTPLVAAVPVFRGRLSPTGGRAHCPGQGVLPQLHGNLAQRSDPSGLWLVLYGLFKKMVVADQIGAFVVDPCFADPAAFSSPELILAAYAYAFQIFLDFSAYSDIALGLGRIFGLALPSISGCLMSRPTPGVLAALAHHPVLLAQGLPLHPPGRQPGLHLVHPAQFDDNHAPGRAVARGRGATSSSGAGSTGSTWPCTGFGPGPDRAARVCPWPA